MFRACVPVLFGAMLVLSGGLSGQEKDDPKPAKKDEGGPTKFKGQLPPNWKKIGLTDEQVQTVYKIQSKHNEEIDKLEAKIKEHKAARDKELKAVLTPEQKKRLEEILLGKDK
jgi:Spy/CpxP family protein refolding chaperone